jgi:hypothetical protein
LIPITGLAAMKIPFSSNVSAFVLLILEWRSQSERRETKPPTQQGKDIFHFVVMERWHHKIMC